MNQLAINTVGEELEASADFCKSEGLGLEVTDFAFPSILDEDLTERIERHKKAVAGISPIISHGPFFDLVASSLDPKIVEVSRLRHKAAFAASIEIGASYYITHTNFMPLIRESSYRKNWAGRMLDFWLPFADDAGKSNIIICFENLWDPVPDIQAELIVSGSHPHLRASFDNGHALVFSDLPSSQWTATLGPLLAHCHLHDNSGELDEHKPVGEGKEDWAGFLEAVQEYSPDAILVAESDRLNDNQQSIAKLRTF